MQAATPGTAGPPSSPLRFGPSGRFELQPAERRLLIDGAPAPLGGRAFDLLLAMAAQPDHLLTKNELLDRVWPGLVVEEANLQVQISNLRKLLGGDVIATVPGRGYRFAAVLDKASAVVASPPAPAAVAQAVPQRLFGRDADLARVESMLQTGGCVTLVGTSGVGKTSLARTAAARWTSRSAWVDLAPLAHGGQVIAAVARALSVQLSDGDAAPQLLRALQGHTALLVLDNAEHLVESCAQLAVALSPLPDLRLLVTSQLPLAVPSERVQRLEPLEQPDAATLVLGDGALALLVDRIVAADHRFVVTPETLPLLKTLCEQLDGLPLALEMAAARVPTLGLRGVHEALAQRFALLTRGHRTAAARHKTLHNALDWSYRLLGENEQRLFRALGVFAGGFTLELAVAVCANDDAARWDVIDGVATLVDRSLVAASHDDPPRYRLLETMRAFALEQLATDGEEPVVRKRHADAVVGFFARHPAGDGGSISACEAEMENAREAFAFAQAHDLSTAAMLTARVSLAVTFSVWQPEASAWLRSLEPLMEQPAAQALAADLRATWWTELARVLLFRGEKRAKAAARRAVALWKPLQEPRRALSAAVAWVRSIDEAVPELDEACAELAALVAALPDLPPRARLSVHGAFVKAAGDRGDYEAALAGRREEMALAESLGLHGVADAADSNIVLTLLQLGRFAEAAERGEALLARIDAGTGSGDSNLPWVFAGLMPALIKLGRLERAQALVARAWKVGQRRSALVVLAPLAQLAVAQQRFEAAATLIGYTRENFESRAVGYGDSDALLLNEAEAAVKAALGTTAAEMVMRQGRSLGEAAAAALAHSGAA